MDVVLERILSLLPKKENGDFKFGAKKEFATSIGYTDGQIVSMWENGTSLSYMGKLHEIAMKYDVSVEWLRGETDIKKESPPQEARGELSPAKLAFIDKLSEISDDDLILLNGLLDSIIARRSK